MRAKVLSLAIIGFKSELQKILRAFGKRRAPIKGVITVEQTVKKEDCILINKNNLGCVSLDDFSYYD